MNTADGTREHPVKEGGDILTIASPVKRWGLWGGCELFSPYREKKG